MKIEQGTPSFSPIILTIESVEELVQLTAAMGVTSAADRRRAAFSYYQITLPGYENGDDMYNALKEKLQPYFGQTL